MAAMHPAVRAGAIQDALAFLDTYEAGARARVLARIPLSSRELLLNTARSSWVDIEHDRLAVDVIVSMFGPARAVQYWRRATSRLIERPLLKSFVSGMLNLLGEDLGRFVAIVPKGWSLVYRDFCTILCDRTTPGRAVLEFTQIAPEVRAAPNYFLSWHGTCLGVCDMARARVAVEFSSGRDRSSASATFSWSTAASESRAL